MGKYCKYKLYWRRRWIRNWLWTNKWKPKKNISHTFNNKENEPIILFPFIFGIIVFIPLLYFIYYIFIIIGTSITFGGGGGLNGLDVPGDGCSCGYSVQGIYIYIYIYKICEIFHFETRLIFMIHLVWNWKISYYEISVWNWHN